MINLSTPRAYAFIKPLHGSAGKPIRCADPCLASPTRHGCTHCRAVCTSTARTHPHCLPEMHAWYYDLSADHSLSQDPESLLVWLCAGCAALLAGSVQFAGTDDLHDGPCWQCGEPIQPIERNLT